MDKFSESLLPEKWRKGNEMKIILTIPESAIEDVKEYCKLKGIDLHGRMQQKLINFIANAKEQMLQRRLASKKEILNAD